ncbi:MAG: creatininase family protein [Actinobacteria bacterium]|nr:creatininase family protein [Actinomycetota bacterium]
MNGRIIKLEDISGLKLDSLNRDNVLVIIPVGILEYHAHHLPYGTDYYINRSVTELIAESLHTVNPGIDILLYPDIPLGVFGIENLSITKFPTIGSFVIEPSTMTNVLVELIGKFIQFKFNKFVIISFHGAPEHCRALNEAADHLTSKYDVKVIPVLNYLWFPLFFGGELITKIEEKTGRKFSELEKNALLHFVHAEIVETSAMLYLKPELVNPIYRGLKPVVFDYKEMFEKIKELEEWHGYVGDPAPAREDIGKAVLETVAEECSGIILKYLQDKNHIKKLKRYPEGL